jgi:8-oxo-dGTP pyrophosphatase MutT (NUDIX family)
VIAKWQTVNIIDNFDLTIFQAQKVQRRNPENNKTGVFTVLNSKDWANVIPITNEGKIVMVEQYRHGTDEITFELPGGLIEIDEKPDKAAMRECKEETGFVSNQDIVLLGVSRPNPAFLNNKCYSYLWENCGKVCEQNLDTHEVINIHEFSQEEVKHKINSGIINHCVILTAFYFFSLRYKF